MLRADQAGNRDPDLFDDVFISVFRIYFYVAGASVAVSAVFALAEPLGMLDAHSLANRIAGWLSSHITPVKTIEWMWRAMLDTSNSFWIEYNKLGFYLLGPSISGSFKGFSNKHLPRDESWRKSLSGQVSRLVLIIIYSALFGLLFTIVIWSWPFYLWVILRYLPMQIHFMDPESGVKMEIWKDTVKATIVVIVSVVVAVLSSSS
jgi:hypothetical protein